MIIRKKLKQVDGLYHGLIPTPVDPRDFSLGGLSDQIDIKTVPLIDFVVAEPLEIKNQDGIVPDGCTGYSLTAVSEDQEEVILDPGFTFAMIKKVQGSWKGWGGDLRSGCKVAQNIGFIEKGQNPLDFGGKPRDFIANWNNWPLDILLPLAQKHHKQSYFKVDGRYDVFDNIRAALWQHKDQKESVYTGCLWRPGWLYVNDGIIPQFPISGGVGHAFKIFGQKIINGEPFLMCQNSYGINAGKDGIHFFSRKVVNREFDFGAYMFIDMPPEEAKEILRGKGLLVETPPSKNIFDGFWTAIRNLFI